MTRLTTALGAAGQVAAFGRRRALAVPRALWRATTAQLMLPSEDRHHLADALAQEVIMKALASSSNRSTPESSQILSARCSPPTSPSLSIRDGCPRRQHSRCPAPTLPYGRRVSVTLNWSVCATPDERGDTCRDFTISPTCEKVRPETGYALRGCAGGTYRTIPL